MNSNDVWALSMKISSYLWDWAQGENCHHSKMLVNMATAILPAVFGDESKYIIITDQYSKWRGDFRESDPARTPGDGHLSGGPSGFLNFKSTLKQFVRPALFILNCLVKQPDIVRFYSFI